MYLGIMSTLISIMYSQPHIGLISSRYLLLFLQAPKFDSNNTILCLSLSNHNHCPNLNLKLLPYIAIEINRKWKSAQRDANTARWV